MRTAKEAEAPEMIRSRADWERLLRMRFGMKASESPCSWPVRRIRATIARRFPVFKRARVTVLRRAHNLVVEVDRTFVFKFPWHPKADCMREIAILKALRGKLGVAIPMPVFVGPRGRFFGAPLIPGHRPRVEEVRRWSGGRRAALARDLARLCASVQRAIRPGLRGRIMGPRTVPAVADVDRTEQAFRRIFTREWNLLAESRRLFDDYRKRVSGLRAGNLRIVGFDLQLDNLLVDRDGRLVGAVDFGYLTWRDAPGLFGLLSKDDPELARMAMKAFASYTGTRLDPRQAETDGLFDVLSYLVELSTNRWDLAARRREFVGIAKRGLRSR
ncbi:MAG: aminoglycoside phosphotransferase family protein [Candidatus Coatesbacteria bacterium]